MTAHKKTGKRAGERGAVFFYIFLVIALLGTLTYVISQMGQSDSGVQSSAQQSDQVSRLLGQAALLTGALQQMIVNGADPNTLGANLITVTGGATWDDGVNNRFKIYHPYGGGVKYIGQTGTGTGTALDDSSNMANNFQIRTNYYVKGVGPTDITSSPHYPDILFTASVSSKAACQLINMKVRGTAAAAAPPKVTDDATFTHMFIDATNTADTKLDDNLGGGANTCAGCVNLLQSCVSNNADDAYGYYQVLLPG